MLIYNIEFIKQFLIYDITLFKWNKKWRKRQITLNIFLFLIYRFFIIMRNISVCIITYLLDKYYKQKDIMCLSVVSNVSNIWQLKFMYF